MAKSHISKSEKRRLERKASNAVAVETATRIRIIAETITDQAALRTMLLPVADVEQRRKYYEFMKPYLKFHSAFPSSLDPESRIILP